MIPVNEPLIDGNEKAYLEKCINDGWISSEGPFVSEFEEKFSSSVNRQFGVAVSSGTAAIDIAIAALGLGDGDEVILPTFTIISCITQIIRSGATPVLVDSDPHSWNMDINQVEDKITPKTKAIMAVHIYGLPVDMTPILELADKYGLFIIEDAAEVYGQTYNGKPCGSFGDISTFSFYPNKHLTTGEGGMLVTNNKLIAEKAKSFRNLCFQNKQRFVHEELGWNYRMTNIQAAIGLAQIERTEEFVAKKRKMGELYSNGLKNNSKLQLPLAKTDFAENIFWVFGLVLTEQVDYDAAEAMKRLAHNNIGSRPFFWPMHEQPVLIKMGLFNNEKYPVAENLARRGFYIPSGLAMDEEQIKEVIDVIKFELS
ncbi:hypothetical protein LCGC14_1298580 [marine sediment metagenome]|uniref:Aminotransferase DegT n=1 Tax=marine sediment metagenome TaxID=412755 RepID=A0A0F9KRW3_9ZZZZ